MSRCDEESAPDIPAISRRQRRKRERSAPFSVEEIIYRARDRLSNGLVALKLITSNVGDSPEGDRFVLEAQFLSELRHPGIVSYVAHGATATGQRFLAMEWLDGHDLARRLNGGPLPLSDTLHLARRLAEALQVAHRRGVIHRDIKPTNLFLPGGDIGGVKLLDFGIARRLAAVRPMTRTGAVIGTPEYMAPEQARGSRDLSAAADIFSTGCVLYECLTGDPPFVAEHIAAVLVRILFEEPQPLIDKRPGIPDSIVALIGDMLCKDPQQRIADADALLQRLAQLGDVQELPRDPSTKTRPTIPLHFADSEQRLFSLVVASPPEYDDTDPRAAEAARAATMLATAVKPDESHRTSLVSLLRELGARADFLIDGALVVTVPQTGSATDQAVMAARVALLIKERWTDAAVAVTTGRGVLKGSTAVGDVADRAARLLHARGARAHEGNVVRLDPLTARLLGPSFMVTFAGDEILLTGEAKAIDESRRLLGKPTPCVGRDTELAMLQAQLLGCIEEGDARAIIVTAHPGVGKSRLRHEFIRRVEKRSEPLTLLLGRGDMIGAGSPYAIVASALRSLCGLSGSEPPDVQKHKLAARIARHVAPQKAGAVTAFLGELCQIPFSEAELPQLRSARQDPKLLLDCVRRAWLDFLTAECAAATVLLILDDLQWGDALSVALIDESLHELRSAPLLVLSFARPEVDALFPKLWTRHGPQRLQLKPLSKKACERLIEQVLGRDIPQQAVARAVEQSAGNALFLEAATALVFPS